VLLFLTFIILKYIEHKHYSAMKNSKGESIKGISIFDFLNIMFPDKTKSVVRRSMENHEKYGNIHLNYMLWVHGVSVSSPEFAKQILTDAKTFRKPVMDFVPTGEFSSLFTSKHVVSVNGEDWKRQRKSMDNGKKISN
jgi:cytochrome P450